MPEFKEVLLYLERYRLLKKCFVRFKYRNQVQFLLPLKEMHM